MTIDGFRRAAAIGAITLLAGCASPQQQPPAAVQAPVPPAQVEVVYSANPATGQIDGPFDPATGRRIMTEPGPDGQARVVLDPATLKPVLLDDFASPVMVAQPVVQAPAQVSRSRRTKLTVDPASVVLASTPASHFGAQLAIYWTPEEAKKGWAALVSSNPELSGKVPFLAQAANRAGRPFFRLIATGFESEKDAKAACSVLASRNEDCIPTQI